MTAIKNIFWNAQEGRLRAFWRILTIMIILVALFQGVFFFGIIKGIMGGFPSDPELRSFLTIISLAISATTAIFIARKWVDKKSILSLGLKLDGTAAKDLIFGFLLSIFMMAGFIGLLISFDLATINGIMGGAAAMTMTSFVILFTTTVLVGWWEELAFRGAVFQNMEEGLGIKIAVVISCLLYGVLHAANPNATLLSSLIIIAFGAMRLLGYLRTRQLWLSMGMHISWNFFQGPVGGFAMSGQDSKHILDVSLNGPDHLTGGAFGPEGSFFILPMVALAVWAMWAWTKDRVQ